jgi:arylsulfatase A-like enzyme
MRYRFLLATAFLMAAGWGTIPPQLTATASAPSAVGGRPNIVVIMTDDQTAASIAKMPLTTQLIGGAGTTFTNSFVSNALCCPSRATFLTGQYSHNNGVWSNTRPDGGYRQLDNTNTLAVWLKNGGYRTAHIGRYLRGYGMVNQREIPPGWTEWYGGVGVSSAKYFGYTLNENGVLKTYRRDSQENNYQTDVETRKATEFIARSAGDTAPFFLSIGYLANHEERHGQLLTPPLPAKRHRGAFANEPLPRPPSFDEADVSDKPEAIRNLPLFSPEALARITRLYRTRLATLLAVDEGVRDIVAALQAHGKLDNTVIIFTSDNGFATGEHRIELGKMQIYEEVNRVPLLIRGPGVAHQVRDELVVNVDLAPTIVALAGITANRTMDGISLVPLLTNQAVTWRSSFLLEGASRRYFAVRTRDKIYAEHETGEKEQYDLGADPYQLNSQTTYDPLLVDRLNQLKACAGASCR